MSGAGNIGFPACFGLVVALDMSLALRETLLQRKMGFCVMLWRVRDYSSLLLPDLTV